MSERDESDEQAQVTRRAAEWYVRLRDKNLSEADEQRYLRWLKESPDHLAEIFRMEQLHRLLKQELPKRSDDGSPQPRQERRGRFGDT